MQGGLQTVTEVTEGLVMARGNNAALRLHAIFSGYAQGAQRNTVNIIDIGNYAHIYVDNTAKMTYYISLNAKCYVGVISITRNLTYTILDALPSDVTEITTT